MAVNLRKSPEVLALAWQCAATGLTLRPQKVQPLSALHPHQGGFYRIIVQPFLRPVGIFFLVKRTNAHAVYGAPGLLALSDLGLHAQQQQPGALLLGVLRRAKSTRLDEIVERICP